MPEELLAERGGIVSYETLRVLRQPFAAQGHIGDISSFNNVGPKWLTALVF